MGGTWVNVDYLDNTRSLACGEHRGEAESTNLEVRCRRSDNLPDLVDRTCHGQEGESNISLLDYYTMSLGREK